jgi:hypothetical protein
MWMLGLGDVGVGLRACGLAGLRACGLELARGQGREEEGQSTNRDNIEFMGESLWLGKEFACLCPCACVRACLRTWKKEKDS